MPVWPVVQPDEGYQTVGRHGGARARHHRISLPPILTRRWVRKFGGARPGAFPTAPTAALVEAPSGWPPGQPTIPVECHVHAGLGPVRSLEGKIR